MLGPRAVMLRVSDCWGQSLTRVRRKGYESIKKAGASSVICAPASGESNEKRDNRYDNSSLQQATRKPAARPFKEVKKMKPLPDFGLDFICPPVILALFHTLISSGRIPVIFIRQALSTCRG